MSDDKLKALSDILGRDAVLTEATDTEPFLVDHRRLYQGRALAVVLPRSVEELARTIGF